MPDETQTAAERIADALDEIRKQKPDLWRADVSGVACFVRGEETMHHLERVNLQVAKMKMALHRILHMDPEEWGKQGIYKAQKIANEGLGRND